MGDTRRSQTISTESQGIAKQAACENCLQGSKVMRQTGCRLFGLPLAHSLWQQRNLMREILTYGTVGRAPGDRCLYPELDQEYSRLRCRFAESIPGKLVQTNPAI